MTERATPEEGAAISDCGHYRYALWREIEDTLMGNEGTCLFVMLNPSTADATTDDATIRRCIGFASKWGFARLSVGNAYAPRATDPRELKQADDPIGPENDGWLLKLEAQASEVIVAWGANIETDREREVVDLLYGASVRCLGQTAALHPKHPLYLAADTKRQVFKRLLGAVR